MYGPTRGALAFEAEGIVADEGVASSYVGIRYAPAAEAVLRDDVHADVSIALTAAVYVFVPEPKRLSMRCDLQQRYTRDTRLLRRQATADAQFARSLRGWSIPDLVEAFRGGLRPHDRVVYVPGTETRASLLYIVFLVITSGTSLLEFAWGAAGIALCTAAGIEEGRAYEGGLTPAGLREAFEGPRGKIRDLIERMCTARARRANR